MEHIPSLSRREKDVVTLLLQGKSNKQLALALGISERTIEFHLTNVYTKLQVSSRVEAILALGKTTGAFAGKLEETAVDISLQDGHNGKRLAVHVQWVQSWKNIVSTTQKEFAMLKITVLEYLESFLRKHPLFLAAWLFVAVSALVRYLVIDMGLYLWFSYLVLGVFLGIGSLYFGFSLRTIATATGLRPYKLLAWAIGSPLLVALPDVVLRYAIARTRGITSITIAGISNKMMWIAPLNSRPYFYTERMIPNDKLWLYAMLGLVGLFFLGVSARHGGLFVALQSQNAKE